MGAGATGEWAGQDGALAAWRGGGWLFVQPRDGWIAWVRDISTKKIFTGGSWVLDETDFDNLPSVGINATADATNRLSVSADATLLNNDGAGHQIKINKATAADTASVLYQTGFSGRAEFGLAGNDDFSIKVSDDGAAWNTAITVTATSGRVQLGHVLQLTPGAEPTNAASGDVYFDSATAKLRCYDGSMWQDLF